MRDRAHYRTAGSSGVATRALLNATLPADMIHVIDMHRCIVILSIWGLVIAPSLCRAEFMTGCCDEPREVAPEGCTSSDRCGQDGGAGSHDASHAGCTDDCCPVAKPDDDPPAAHDFAPSAADFMANGVAWLIGPPCHHAAPAAPTDSPRTALPCHPSDLPLLI